MKTKLLLPHHFKIIGAVLLLFALFLFAYSIIILKGEFEFLELKTFAFIYNENLKGENSYFNFTTTNLTNTVLGAIFILGGLLVVFSREKEEDEYVANLRLQSFQWSFLINYFLLFVFFIGIWPSFFDGNDLQYVYNADYLYCNLSFFTV